MKMFYVIWGGTLFYVTWTTQSFSLSYLKDAPFECLS